jgi:hypothetical protein
MDTATGSREEIEKAFYKTSQVPPERAYSVTRLLPCIFRGERGDVGVASSAETRNQK